MQHYEFRCFILWFSLISDECEEEGEGDEGDEVVAGDGFGDNDQSSDYEQEDESESVTGISSDEQVDGYS